MNETDAKKRFIYGALAAALVLAASLLLLLKSGNRSVAFPEFQKADALDGRQDCYFNELDVLDRYAEEQGKAKPSELLLAGYKDSDENETLLSLLIEPDESLYERLAPYYAESDAKTELITLSGYFFCEPLNTHNAGAESAFRSDADEYLAWKGETGVKIPVVLRFAGATEAEYRAAKRAENRSNTVMSIVLFVLAAACGVRLLTLREKKTA